MRKWLKTLLGVGFTVAAAVALAGCQQKSAEKVKQKLSDPGFEDVSVHDPSIVKDGSEYYIFGSHMQFAKSSDLIKWTQLSSSVNDQTLFTDINASLGKVFDLAQSSDTWAGDIEHWGGKYYMYYCSCQGTNPTAVLGLATADKITGPYKNQGILLK